MASGDDLRYPVGRFEHEGPISDEQLQAWIGEIAALPAQMRAAARGLTDGQLDTPYRPGGWTLRQVIHHVPDSHLNAVLRFKLALTQDRPTINPYNEAAWAELGDVPVTPVETSLDLLAALHARWVALLSSLAPEAWDRTYLHPDDGEISLRRVPGIYAWHGRHHLAHLTTTIERHGWH
ncbi:MAG: YfiT family bacillithiol transferase [Bacteroidota bacterium]